MRWWIYQILFAIAYIAMLPKFLFRMARRGGYADRFADRFGRYPAEVEARLKAMAGEAVWIHAVSVGEVAVASGVMSALRRVSPSLRFVLSTTSSTGWAQAQKVVTENDVAIYCPLDFPPCVNRALTLIRPRAFLLTETELWPNLIRACHHRGIALFLVNARISDHSAPGYRRLRFWFGPVLRCFTRIYAQSSLDASRLQAAGADERTIEITGSFKFDTARRNEAVESQVAAFLARCGLANEHTLLLGGSTWPGEDRLLLEAYHKLRADFPALRLAIVPRHFEKADAIESNVQEFGMQAIRKSRAGDLEDEGRIDAFRRGDAVVIGDTTGELAGFFARADMVLVGKTFFAEYSGGQNMIEPCLYGCAVLTGPGTENFRPVMSDLLEKEALVRLDDASQIEPQLRSWLEEPAACRSLRDRAAKTVAERTGTVARCAEGVFSLMSDVVS